MEQCNVALFGCGTVGMGVARALLEGGALRARIGDRVRLKYIVDLRLDDVRRELNPPDDVILTDSVEAPLGDPDVRVAVELFGGIEAAGAVIERALAAGKDVITANKALLAERGDDLYRIARRAGRAIAFEAAVAGGIPVIGAMRDGLIGERIESIYGIVNGTCNYILTRMLERGIPYDQALAEAQEAGYAEADPGLDVMGLDSAHKLAVLARLAFGMNVRLEDIHTEGISAVELSDLRYARSLGYTLKLLAIGIARGQRLELRVHPALLHREHPLAVVGGVYNAVCIHGDQVGEVVLTGKGAGRKPTASAVVADIARVALGTYQIDFRSMAPFGDVPDAAVVPVGEIETRYYFRLDCRDCPGVLAAVANILGEEQISLASVRQQEPATPREQFVPVVFMSHEAHDEAMRQALDRINRLDVIRAESTRMIRVEDI